MVLKLLSISVSRNADYVNVSIDFDEGFSDWDHKYMHLLSYSSTQAKLLGLSVPLNKSSTKAQGKLLNLADFLA